MLTLGLCLALGLAHPPLGLRVRGTEVLEPNGKPIVMRGYNVMWWVFPSRERIRTMRSMGANTARYMFGYSTSGRPQSTVDDVVRQAEALTREGLWVIPVVHDFRIEGKAPYDSEKVQKEFLSLWRQIVLRLKGNPRIGAWEPMNEPHDADSKTVSDWYRRTILEFRKWDSGRPIVVEGTGYSWPQNLTDDLVIADPQTIYSFHTYGPWEYVSQAKDALIPYPGKWGRSELKDAILPAVRFRERHQVPVWCGEWGVPSRLPGHSQWIDDVASILEECRIPWTYWAWAEKPENPLDDTFDVNPKKKALFDQMRRLFRQVVQPASR